MTVAAAPEFVTAVGDDVTENFTFDKPVFATSELSVFTFDPATDTLPQLVDPANYTVQLLAEYAGANVIFDTAPADGIKVGIVRHLPLAQTVDVGDTEYVPPSELEKALDRVVLMMQQAEGIADRAVQDDPFDFTAAARANRALVYDNDGRIIYSDGRVMFSGSGVPSAGIGIDGDFYIDTAAKSIYGPKSGGAWGSGVIMSVGDMLKATYDPLAVAGDAFDMDNMADGAAKVAMTAAERAKVGHLTVTQAVDLDAMETRVNELDASVILMGSWDASVGTFPGGGTAQNGESWIVSAGGTVDGVVFSVNDRIVALADNASTTIYAANWLKLDYTDQVLSVNGEVGAVVLDPDDLDDSATANKFTDAADIAKLAGIEANATADQTVTEILADSFTPSHTGGVARTLRSKVEEIVSVKDFGAVGDSTGTGAGTDDKAALDLAEAAGAGPVFFPTGGYRLSTAPTLTRPIVGLGIDFYKDDASEYLPRFQYDFGTKDEPYFWLKKVNASGDYTDTPTVYTFVPELTALYIEHVNAAGYQQNLDGSGGGRTTAPTIRVYKLHSGYGDAPAYSAALGITRHAGWASVTNWLGHNALSVLGGRVDANTENVNVAGIELHLADAGHDNVAAPGFILDMERTGANTAGYETPWLGFRVQNTAVGGVPIDAAFQVVADANVGLDLAGADFQTAQAAIALAANQRIYFNADPFSAASDQWFAGNNGAALNSTYITYSSTLPGYTFVLNNNSELQISSTQTTIPSNKLKVNVGDIEATGGNILAVAGSVSDVVGRLQAVPRSTTAALAAIGNAINTANKFSGKVVINTTTAAIVTANGATAGAVWLALDGTTAHTPA
ncbi:MAG: hypothetical protein Q8P46_07010 [Hyphomicrobiales bacterium]|nr:hypothetical protein [Hyphomicrobiales bacterium]